MTGAVFFIAMRHLVVRRRQTVFTVLGLAVGVMVLISAISMMDGLKVSFIEQMLQVSPHITVHPEPVLPERMDLVAGDALVDLVLPEAPDEEDYIKNYRKVAHQVETVPGALVAAPELVLEGFVVYGTMERSAQVHGVLPEKQKHIGNLTSRAISGTYEDFQAAPDGAFIGYRLAERLTVEVGDRFQVVGRTGEPITFRVSALMKTGVTSFDQSHVLVHLAKAQILDSAASDRVTEINVRVADPDAPAPAAASIQRATGLVAETWKQTHANVLSLYGMIGRISYFLVIFTMLAAGLGVSNLLTTVVLQKKKDIAVLLSMGYSRSAIGAVFLIEGVTLGAVGALLGCALGYGNTQFLASLPMNFGESAIIERSGLYMNQDIMYYVMSAAFGFVVSLVAGFVPARRAARLDPIEIIRTEV